ncbi:MAG: hypothetical protein WAV09_02195 [Minisyncoccia bacterium]
MNYLGDIITLLFFLALSSGLGILWWRHWNRHVQATYINSLKWVNLEVRLPRDIFKSPLAMEIVLNSIHQGGGTGEEYSKRWNGKVRSWFSLEIVSIEGEIHFFIRAIAKYKNVIEAAIYSQYPGAEVAEVDDFTNTYRYDESIHEMWGTNYQLIGEDYLPLRTYVDFGLDKDPKEEFKTDPLTPLLEWMGSIKEKEYIFFQIVCRAADGKFDTWKKEAQKGLNKIYYGLELDDDGIKAKKAELKKELKTLDIRKSSDLTEAERQRVEMITRNIQKQGFECMIRCVYMAEKKNFKSANIEALAGALRAFTWNNYNGFKPGGEKTGFDFPWEDYSGKRLAGKKNDMGVFITKRKSFYKALSDDDWYNGVWTRFFEDIKDAFMTKFIGPDHDSSYSKDNSNKDRFILNAEELATIFHFPGQTAAVPSLKRIGSKKAEPPTNLPF